MAIKDIKVGPMISQESRDDRIKTVHDYSHLANVPGYSIHVRTSGGADPDSQKFLRAELFHNNHSVGEVGGCVGHENGRQVFYMDTARISEDHRGQGLGVALYEAAIAHAHHAHGAQEVWGDVHSTSAHRVHHSLATKHGMKYAAALIAPSKDESPFDSRYGQYQYTIKSEPDESLMKAISDLQVGKQTSWGIAPSWDYNHLLTEEHRKAGYRLSIEHSRGAKNLFYVLLHHPSTLLTGPNDMSVGDLEAFITHPSDLRTPQLNIDVADLSDKHWGKGLGKVMYEAAMAHAYHVHGARTVAGGLHSTMADRVHRSLSRKHGMNYDAQEAMTIGEPGAWDNRFGHYRYAMKAENKHPMSVEHYSPVEGLNEIDPAYQGTGATGEEKGRPHRIPRSYYYFAGAKPEGEVVGLSRAKYKGVLPPGTKLYDFEKDELNLLEPKWIQTKHGMLYDPPDLDEVEKEINSRGYHGYFNFNPSNPDALALFRKLKVEQVKEDQGLKKVEYGGTDLDEAQSIAKIDEILNRPIVESRVGVGDQYNQDYTDLLWAAKNPAITPEQQRKLLSTPRLEGAHGKAPFEYLMRNPALDVSVLKSVMMPLGSIVALPMLSKGRPNSYALENTRDLFLANASFKMLEGVGLPVSDPTEMYHKLGMYWSRQLDEKTRAEVGNCIVDAATDANKLAQISPDLIKDDQSVKKWVDKCLSLADAMPDGFARNGAYDTIMRKAAQIVEYYNTHAKPPVLPQLIDAAINTKVTMPRELESAIVYGKDKMGYENIIPKAWEYCNKIGGDIGSELKDRLLGSKHSTPEMIKAALEPKVFIDKVEDGNAESYTKRLVRNGIVNASNINEVFKRVRAVSPKCADYCAGRALYEAVNSDSAVAKALISDTPAVERPALWAEALADDQAGFISEMANEINKPLLDTLTQDALNIDESEQGGMSFADELGYAIEARPAETADLRRKYVDKLLDDPKPHRQSKLLHTCLKQHTRELRYGGDGADGKTYTAKEAHDFVKKVADLGDMGIARWVAQEGGFSALNDEEFSALLDKALKSKGETSGAMMNHAVRTASEMIGNYSRELSPELVEQGLKGDMGEEVARNLMEHDGNSDADEDKVRTTPVSPSMRVLADYIEKHPSWLAKDFDLINIPDLVNHLPKETLLACKDVDVVKRHLAKIDPDIAAAGQVKVKLGTTKARKFRDLIMQAHQTKRAASVLPENVDKPEGQWALPKEVPNWSKLVEIGRMPNGSISAGKIQSWIDQQPEHQFNYTHGKWTGSQRHNGEDSNVFQLNITKATLDKMKNEMPEVYKTWNKLYQRFKNNGHPLGPFGVGWVRWTGNKNDGYFIDELQSDIGQNMIRADSAVRMQAHKNRWGRYIKSIPAIAEDLKTHKPEEWRRYDDDFVESPDYHLAPKALLSLIASGKVKTPEDVTDEMLTQMITESVSFNKEIAQANKDYPPEHLEEISKLLFGGTHPGIILHEAFQQWLRDQGHVGAKVAVHSVYSKAPHSGWDLDKVVKRVTKKKNKKTGQEEEVANYQLSLPGHARVAYDQHPNDMGMEPAVYGNLPSQSGPDTEMDIPSVDSATGKVTNVKTPTPIFQGEVHKSEDEDWRQIMSNLPEIILG